MTFMRSSVMLIEAMITSCFFASSPGLRPSQSCSMISHSTFICSHSAYSQGDFTLEVGAESTMGSEAGCGLTLESGAVCVPMGCW